MKRTALAAFGALPPSTEIQRRFAEWFPSEHGGKPVPEWFRSRDARPAVRLLPLGGNRFVSVSAMINAGSCSDGVFESLWGLWEIEATTGKLLPRTEPTGRLMLDPAAIADIDGDGKPEILFNELSNLGDMNAAGQPETMDRGIVRARDGLYVDVEGLSIPDFICPC